MPSCSHFSDKILKFFLKGFEPWETFLSFLLIFSGRHTLQIQACVTTASTQR